MPTQSQRPPFPLCLWLFSCQLRRCMLVEENKPVLKAAKIIANTYVISSSLASSPGSAPPGADLHTYVIYSSLALSPALAPAGSDLHFFFCVSAIWRMAQVCQRNSGKSMLRKRVTTFKLQITK